MRSLKHLLPLLAWAVALPAAAQNRPIDRAPARPRLAADADTNDANGYFALGVDLVSRVARQPNAAHDAAAAFYWASRLDPRSADAVYARRAALLLEDSTRLLAAFGDPAGRIPAADGRYLDSLQLRARQLDPFVRENLDALLITRFLQVVIAPRLRRQGMAGTEADFSPADLRNYIARHARDFDVGLAARYHFCEGRFDSALILWDQQARLEPRDARIHVDRARAFYYRGQLDSTRGSLERALAVARRDDADSMRFIYESKAAWEYALGRVDEQLHDIPAARAAYERALTEDLTWFPAHLQLAQILLQLGDTAAGMVEYGRAVQSADDEYLPHANYGFRLATRGRLDSAAVELRRATGIEPFAIESYLLLGLVYDARHDTAQARQAFSAFVALAPRDHPRLPRVQARLAELGP